MNYKEHLKIGLILEGITLFVIGLCIYYFSWSFDISYMIGIWIVITIFISPLSPDLDHYNGKLRELWIGLGLAIGIYGIFTTEDYMMKGIICSSIPFIIPYLTSHRGIIHSVPFTILYGVILYYLTQNVYVAVVGFVGFWSHLWADGIPFKMK